MGESMYMWPHTNLGAVQAQFFIFTLRGCAPQRSLS